jgi:hypothetical protein
MNSRSKASKPAAKANESHAATRPGEPGIDVADGFRSARSALDQITVDLKQLRRHAASLVKGARRPTP